AGPRHARSWVEGGSAAEAQVPREIRSPIDRSLEIAYSADAGEICVRGAVRFARAHWREWARRPVQERFKLLERWVEQVSERKYEIAAALVLEVGKSHLEAIGEVEEALDILPFYYAEYC